ncbi:MAG: hypothetical protein WA993_04915 [Candidatus Binatus sp.]|uniref:hypothetical protein n=1 Tax=Candidatus Binatus sp. TaxID=2811406 RepID=UPI003C9A72CB
MSRNANGTMHTSAIWQPIHKNRWPNSEWKSGLNEITSGIFSAVPATASAISHADSFENGRRGGASEFGGAPPADDSGGGALI